MISDIYEGKSGGLRWTKNEMKIMHIMLPLRTKKINEPNSSHNPAHQIKSLNSIIFLIKNS